MASPPEAVVGSTLETQSTHVAVKVQTAPKEEEGNLDLSAIPHKTDMKPNVLGTTTASASDKVSATTDMFKNALDGQVNDGTTTIASTSDENSKDGSSVSHCKTFANMERVRFGTQETISEGVKLGLKTLDSLANLLNIEGPDGQEASRWLTRFEIIQKKLEQTRTVVGIMGNTGAGKSSLINALLDEEDIIPTSSICACTAVPTEISYNHDADPERAYRGEVEFITEEEWQKEISILLQELVEPGKKLSAEYLQKDTGAGVAYAKIKAVYPNLTNSQLAKSDVKDLMNDPVVKAVLGQVRLHKRSSASDLKSDLQMYVGGPKKNSPDTQGQTPMAYWPLTKIVRIYLKSKVLSTGTVLVDLPGVQDSNAARSAVADRFRAECSSIWIVSPIARAVDDKAAKNLLGTSFKLQLTMDGNYGNVTYICSKTDDIAEREVADILDSDGSIQSLWVKEEECKRKLSLLMHEKRKLGEERDAVEELREELESRTTRKRKIANISESSEPQKGTGADLDEQDVARKNANRIRKQLKAVKSEIGALQEEIKSLSIFATVRCIEARNNYSMTAIRSDFADGVREMLEDAEAQDTGVELPAVEPDYEQIAQSLPVFCVSSRGYQNLMGRSKDRAVQAYRNLEDTQIPQLQNHAVQLGELELTTTRRAFLASLARIMRSLLLWASSSISAGQTPTNPPLPDKKSQTHRLDKLIAALQADLDEGIKTAIATIKAKIHDDLLKPMSSMCIHASPSLHTIASKWPESQTKAGKPMRFSTYRSICVNHGKGVTPISKGMNFNEELYVPMKKRMAGHWAKTFRGPFTEGMALYSSATIDALQKFHDAALRLEEMDCVSLVGLGTLTDQLNARIQGIREAEAKFRKGLRKQQSTFSGWFVEEIAGYMKDVYEKCGSMRGLGCYIRMTDTMSHFVEVHHKDILKKALEEVSAKLLNHCVILERQMGQSSDQFLAKVKENYHMAIAGKEEAMSVARVLPGTRAVQQKVHEFLLGVDKDFEAVVHADAARSASALLVQAQTG